MTHSLSPLPLGEGPGVREPTMPLGLLTIHLQLPGSASLKEKRGRLRPLLARLRREFNLSAAEMDLLDVWDESVIACALVGNETVHVQRSLQQVAHWIETSWLDVDVVSDEIELL
jgi:uncharacterized protein YlxP (DUF503 family)